MKKHLDKLHIYRFEFLLFALVMVLFNKAFFSNQHIYVNYVWPLNMVLLGLASVAMFNFYTGFIHYIKNTLFVLSIIIPFFSEQIFNSKTLTFLGLTTYILYYVLILIEVLKQITRKGEITLSIILGSLCGYLLLAVIAIFSFLLTEFFIPGSYNGIKYNNIPDLYNQISYFSLITIATVGYGDIAPSSESARLIAAFFGICGQFYMVTLVGIIISKFTSKN